MMRAYTLVRDEDNHQWRTLARVPDEAVQMLSGEVGKPLFICEGPSTYTLKWGEHGFGGEIVYPVSEGEPAFIATISEEGDAMKMTLAAACAAVALTESHVATIDDAYMALNEAIIEHEVLPYECQLKQPWH